MRIPTALFLFVFMSHSGSALAQMFELGDRYPLGIGPSAVVSEDFDGDSDMDLAVCHAGSNLIYIFLNDGVGTFTKHSEFDSDMIDGIAADDLNGDGIIDIYTPHAGVAVYYGNGDGSFYHGFTRSIANWTSRVDAADLNGDGLVELLVSCAERYTGIYILWGTGPGTFGPAEHFYYDEYYTRWVEAADFNNDGHMDIAGAGLIWLNHGDGTFADSIAAPATGFDGRAVDLDQDGFPDLVYLQPGSGCAGIAYVAMNRGDAILTDTAFTDPRYAFLLPASYGAALSACTEDFDLDGMVDIIVATARGPLVLGFNEGSLPFDRTEDVTFKDSSTCVTAADFDGDGDYDIAYVNMDDSMTVAFNVGARRFQTINIPTDYPTIQEGIEHAIDRDTILVQPGTYYELIDFMNKDLVVGSLFMMTGDRGHIENTIIDGSNSGRVVTIQESESEFAELNGFVIQNGQVPSLGGGIYIYDGANPTICNNIIRNNTAAQGGGIFAYNTSASIHHNLIYSNYATAWGGGACLQLLSSDFYNNTVTMNHAGQEADGILCRYGEFAISNTICWGNQPSGGAVSEFRMTAGEELVVYDATISVEYSVIEGGWAGLEIIDSDPLFIDPANGDFNLFASSPCINAGDPDSPADPDGSVADIGAYCYTAPMDVDDGENEVGRPHSFVIGQNFPNPFNPMTSIQYDVPRRSHVTIEVYNVLGQSVCSLVDREESAGSYRVNWDGRDVSGKPVATGVYLYRFQAGNHIETKKMLLMK